MKSKFLTILTAAVIVASASVPASAQVAVSPYVALNPVSGITTSISVGTTAMLVKYVGSTVGKPTVEVAAGGDVTFKIAGAADTTTGSPSLDGIFDLSTPAAAVDTYGELCSLINTTGSNWRCVLLDVLASDVTDNTLITKSATDASSNKGVELFHDTTIGLFSATSVLPPGVESDISYFLPVRVGAKINPNVFSGFQSYLQLAAEKITSGGTVGLFRVIAVTRTYDSNGKVADVTRDVWSITGAATTVRSQTDTGFTSSPFAGAPGEFFIVRQETGTDLTVTNVSGVGFMVKVPKP